jgi:tetratricopeptide (TPR) repeat protein
MAETEFLDAVIVEDRGDHREQWDRAARMLEQARDAGCQDGRSLYLLALAYKRQSKWAQARAVLRQIPQPDAHVFLQLGLLSLRELQLTQAEQEFAKAVQLDATFSEAGYNLLLTRLSLGQLENSVELAGRVAQSAPTEVQRDRLEFLRALLTSSGKRKSDGLFDPRLARLTAEEEQALIELIRGLGRLEVVLDLLRALTAARPMSSAAQEAHTEALLARAKQLLDRCEWTQAEQLLQPLAREQSASRATQAALLNLLGCCACLNQDCETGQDYFREALKLAPSDPLLHQNMALAFEYQNRLPDAEPHWNRYFDLLDARLQDGRGEDESWKEVAFVALSRLAGKLAEKEKWANAIPYQQRALRLQPRDGDALERLFHLYAHAKRQDDARRILRQLQDLRPGEPQYELYELDLIEVRGLKDVEYLLGEIERVHQSYPNDPRVEDKAVGMVGNVIPMMGNLCDQLTDQLNRVLGQVRRLPNYQINWSAVYDVMADLQREFHKLRRITNRCLPLLHHEEQRRVVRNLAEHIDRKIEVCRSVRA